LSQIRAGPSAGPWGSTEVPGSIEEDREPYWQQRVPSSAAVLATEKSATDTILAASGGQSSGISLGHVGSVFIEAPWMPSSEQPAQLTPRGVKETKGISVASANSSSFVDGRLAKSAESSCGGGSNRLDTSGGSHTSALDAGSLPSLGAPTVLNALCRSSECSSTQNELSNTNAQLAATAPNIVSSTQPGNRSTATRLKDISHSGSKDDSGSLSTDQQSTADQLKASASGNVDCSSHPPDSQTVAEIAVVQNCLKRSSASNWPHPTQIKITARLAESADGCNQTDLALIDSEHGMHSNMKARGAIKCGSSQPNTQEADCAGLLARNKTVSGQDAGSIAEEGVSQADMYARGQGTESTLAKQSSEVHASIAALKESVTDAQAMTEASSKRQRLLLGPRLVESLLHAKEPHHVLPEENSGHATSDATSYLVALQETAENGAPTQGYRAHSEGSVSQEAVVVAGIQHGDAQSSGMHPDSDVASNVLPVKHVDGSSLDKHLCVSSSTPHQLGCVHTDAEPTSALKDKQRNAKELLHGHEGSQQYVKISGPNGVRFMDIQAAGATAEERLAALQAWSKRGAPRHAIKSQLVEDCKEQKSEQQPLSCTSGKLSKDLDMPAHALSSYFKTNTNVLIDDHEAQVSEAKHHDQSTKVCCLCLFLNCWNGPVPQSWNPLL
jgi:hypothetical protein